MQIRRKDRRHPPAEHMGASRRIPESGKGKILWRKRHIADVVCNPRPDDAPGHFDVGIILGNTIPLKCSGCGSGTQWLLLINPALLLLAGIRLSRRVPTGARLGNSHHRRRTCSAHPGPRKFRPLAERRLRHLRTIGHGRTGQTERHRADFRRDNENMTLAFECADPGGGILSRRRAGCGNLLMI